MDEAIRKGESFKGGQNKEPQIDQTDQMDQTSLCNI